MKLRLSPLALALFGALFCSALSAQELSSTPIAQLDTIVATSSRLDQSIKSVVGNVSVLNPTDLHKANGQSIVDVMAHQPGIQVYQSGGPQTISGLFIRGASPAQSLVMINGMRINDANTGSVFWNTIDPSLLDRVEIVRGAASSLYGSNAMGGVVNLLTTPNTGGDRALKFKANFGIGTYGILRTSTGISGASNGFDYYLAGSYASSDGFNATTPEAGSTTYHSDKDGYVQAGAVGVFGYTWSPGQRLGVNFFNSYNNGEYDAGSSQSDTYGITHQQAYAISSRNQITDWWQSELQLNYSKINYDSRAPYGRSEFGTKSQQLSWQNNFFLSNTQTLALLLEHTNERVNNSRDLDHHSRNTNAAALIYKADYDRHHVQTSLRRDDISRIGARTTGSLGYAFDVTEALSIGAGFNTGFRAPTFADLYTPLSWGYQGNPDLKPEKSKNIELNVKYQTENTAVVLTLFQGRYRDLINGYVCDANYNCTAKNTNRAKISGVSFDASHRLGNTTLRLGADWLNPKDSESDKLLPRRAKQVYRAGIEHEFDRLTVGADYLFVGKRYDDLANTPEKRMGSYGLVNLHADYAVNKHFSIQLNLNNVLNKSYQTAYGYRNPGANALLNFVWQN